LWEFDDGEPVVSLETATEAWLTHLAATGAKQTSVRAYRSALAKWFMPALKTRSLDRITISDIEHAMRRMREAGRSDKSIRNYVGVIRALFNFATDKRRRWTSRNPAADVDLPKIPTYSEIRYLTSDEVWLLVEHAQTGPFQHIDQAMYLTAAMTGMRIGELQALDWHAVDFVHARIRVRRTWDRKTKTFTTPKSRRSERSIPMPDVVAGHLDRLYKQTPHQADDDLVFAYPATGQPMGHRLMYERLRAALKAAGLDQTYGFHSLRHSYGTALAAQGVPMRTLQEWMGHRDIQTTQRYADYCPNPGERRSSRRHSREVPIRVPTCGNPYRTERNSTHVTTPRRAERPTRDLVRVPPPEYEPRFRAGLFHARSARVARRTTVVTAAHTAPATAKASQACPV
jgi:integrase